MTSSGWVAVEEGAEGSWGIGDCSSGCWKWAFSLAFSDRSRRTSIDCNPARPVISTSRTPPMILDASMNGTLSMGWVGWQGWGEMECPDVHCYGGDDGFRIRGCHPGWGLRLIPGCLLM